MIYERGLFLKYSYKDPTLTPAISAICRVVVPLIPCNATDINPASIMVSTVTFARV